MAFKMNNAPFHKETKYLDDKTNAPKGPKELKASKDVVYKRPPRAPRPAKIGSISGINPLPNEGAWYDPQLKAPGAGIGGSGTGKQRRKAKKNK